MAVQARYPSNNPFPTDLRGSATGNNVLEGLQMPQDRSLFDACSQLPANNGGTVFSEPRSGLTCNASASRKRPREQQHQEQPVPPLPPSPHPIRANLTAIPAKLPPADAAALHPKQSRLLGSGVTSTSGRPALGHGVLSGLSRQNIEIDAIVRLQSERLRSGLEEARKRHCRTLLQTMEQAAARRLREKEAELESAARRNAELEERVREMSAESQVWFDVARNNEAVASSLRATLEQLLLRNAAAARRDELAAEGFGDSDGAAADAQSCCFESGAAAATREGEERRGGRWACKACGERGACVLVLPCRHLCLCSECESRLDSCPACRCAKHGCIQVSLA